MTSVRPVLALLGVLAACARQGSAPPTPARSDLAARPSPTAPDASDPPCQVLATRLCGQVDPGTCSRFAERRAERPSTPTDELQCQAILDSAPLHVALVAALSPPVPEGPCAAVVAHACGASGSPTCAALVAALAARGEAVPAPESAACQRLLDDPGRLRAFVTLHAP